MKFYLEKYCCKYPFHKDCNIFHLYGRPEFRFVPQRKINKSLDSPKKNVLWILRSFKRLSCPNLFFSPDLRSQTQETL